MRGLDLAGIAGLCCLVMAALSVVHGPASAATLVLNDGSIIQGEITTLQDNVYTIETDALGTVRVHKRDIRTINLGNEPESETGPKRPVRSSTNETPRELAEVEAIQSRIVQSPALLSMIEALRSDPDMQAVLSDPEIMSAVAAGDFVKLMNHPKIIALTGNAKVRDVIDQVQ